MRIFLFTIITLIPSTPALAAIFDAADFLTPRSVTVGAFGEVLLSDPSSEGLEARARYGASEDWNLAAILGTGSKNKQFRIGVESVYSFIPDYEGQMGLSALMSSMYLKRNGSGGLYLRVAPMAHKKVSAWNNMPATLYLGLPFSIDARGGNYTTGSHIVIGAVVDTSDKGRFYVSSEAGIRLSKEESYILLGVGLRFGEVRLARGSKNKNTSAKEQEKEYRSEDFSTPSK